MIAETSAMSENDGIIVNQTVTHTLKLWPHGLHIPCGSRISRGKATLIRSVSKPRCCNSGAGLYDTAPAVYLCSTLLVGLYIGL